VSTDVNAHHPLEARLKNWDETQMNLKMEGLRRLYGAAEPIRRGMEVRMCAVCFWFKMWGGGGRG
jgi:proteasome maturation protein